MDDRLTEAAIQEAEKARRERDAALNVAADAHYESQVAGQIAINEAARRASASEQQNDAIRDEALAAKAWGAHNAAARANADQVAASNASEARASATGFIVLLAILVIGGIGWLVWYSNLPKPTGCNTSTVDESYDDCQPARTESVDNRAPGAAGFSACHYKHSSPATSPAASIVRG